MTQQQIKERQRELKQQIILLKDDMTWNEEKMGILLQVSRLQHENKKLREKLYMLNQEVEKQKRDLENIHTEAAIRA